MTITAKPLMHGGNLFRSITEYRWATFFESLDVHYLYESRTFSTDEWSYLPDFYLPHLNTWVEIKGKRPTYEEVQKCQAVAGETGESVVILSGVPNVERFYEGLLPCGFGLFLISEKFSGNAISFSPSELFLFLHKVGDASFKDLSRKITLGLLAAMQTEEHHVTTAGQMVDQILRSLLDGLRYDAQRNVNARKADTPIHQNEETILRLIRDASLARVAPSDFRKIIIDVDLSRRSRLPESQTIF